MSKYFIHVREGERLFIDDEGVEANSLDLIESHIEETVRSILDDEGGWSLDDSRLIEVTDESGAVVLSVPFLATIQRH